MEKNLETWEQQLRDREMWVKEQEKKLEQHISVVVSRIHFRYVDI